MSEIDFGEAVVDASMAITEIADRLDPPPMEEMQTLTLDLGDVALDKALAESAAKECDIRGRDIVLEKLTSLSRKLCAELDALLAYKAKAETTFAKARGRIEELEKKLKSEETTEKDEKGPALDKADLDEFETYLDSSQN